LAGRVKRRVKAGRLFFPVLCNHLFTTCKDRPDKKKHRFSRHLREGLRAGAGRIEWGIWVPSLFRFLFILAVIAGCVYGGMLALVTFVEPQQREMTQTIPPARLNK